MRKRASDVAGDLSWGDRSRSHKGLGCSSKTRTSADTEQHFAADFEISWSNTALLPYRRGNRTCLRSHTKPEAEPPFNPKPLDS